MRKWSSHTGAATGEVFDIVYQIGKQVGKGQVRPEEAKAAAVLAYPVPTTRRELRHFLGMTGYYRCFCKNLSVVGNPLLSSVAQLPYNSFLRYLTADQRCFLLCVALKLVPAVQKDLQS